MLENSLFETPRLINDINECYFYHTIDLPQYGTIRGAWDLRENIEAYLGNFDFAGKTVLDVGTAGGFLTFHIESKGAKVTSFDLASGNLWNIVPYINPKYNLQEARKHYISVAEIVKKGYWFSHRILESQAKCHYGDIYNLSSNIGLFDVAVMGMIISHLRDPIQALFSVSLLVKDYLIISNLVTGETKDCVARLMPDVNTLVPLDAWWSFSQACIERMLNIVGFEVESIVTSEHLCEQSETDEKVYHDVTSFVARRKYSSPVEINPDF